MIQLNFPENVELKVLVEYVSKRLGINILYDEQVGNRRITIKAPRQIPEDSLLSLLESALGMKGMALVDAGQAGWKRIVSVSNLASVSQSPKEIARVPLEEMSSTLAVTRVFELRHTTPQRAEQVITPFLTQPGANSLKLESRQVLIVTDYASNMQRISELIQLVDRPAQATAVEFVQVQHQDASSLAQEALKLMRAKINADFRARGGEGQATDALDIIHHERTNQVVVIGVDRQVADAVQVIRSLDVSLDLTTEVYQLMVASPERIDRLTQELIGPLAAKRLYKSAVDEEAKMLIVTATPSIHQRVKALKADLDVPVSEAQSPIRVYKLINATAADILDTIRSLESEEPLFTGTDKSNHVAHNTQTNTPVMGPPPLATPPEVGELSPLASRAPAGAVRSARATVTADINTNSIIVVARPEIQRTYENLIRMLDRRRPQVLIEVTIATINTTDDYSLGVELSRQGSAGGDSRILNFSSFGLSAVDTATGGLSLIPGLGFNGAVVDSDVADIVVRALKQDTRVKVVSAPKILVNDNATGTLSSIEEQPTGSTTVTQGNPTQTSFGGFVEAGTTITLVPHISQGEYLSLEYSVSLNSFKGTSPAQNLPPPRQTDSIESEVTVPDGSTIIVGGLTRSDESKSVNSVPILGQIPLLKHLVSNREVENSQTTLFVFIRPVILRDDEFEGLKYFSQQQLTLAGLPGDYPASEPLVLR